MGFTNTVAELTKKGAISLDASGRLYLDDEYTVTLAAGTRPVGFDVEYKVGGVAQTISANITGFPPRNAAHPDYAPFRAESVSWSQPDPTSLAWTGTVHYVLTNSGGTQQANGPEVFSAEFYSNSITSPLLFQGSSSATATGQLCNSAGDPITPQPNVEIASPCFRCVMRSSVAPSSMLQFMGAINSDEITILGVKYPKYTARCTFSAKEAEKVPGTGSTSVQQYEYTLTIEGNFTPAPAGGKTVGGTAFSSVFGTLCTNGPLLSGWVQLVADAGPNFYKSGKKVRATVTAEDDPTVSVDSPVPVFLKSDGTQADPSTDGIRYFLVPSGPVTAFSGLNLPTTW